MAVVTLSEMMEAGAHFGHQTRRWNPKMSRYIYCARNGVHIIDLVQTAVCMNNAYKWTCLLYTSPSPRDMRRSRMPSSA